MRTTPVADTYCKGHAVSDELGCDFLLTTDFACLGAMLPEALVPPPLKCDLSGAERAFWAAASEMGFGRFPDAYRNFRSRNQRVNRASPPFRRISPPGMLMPGGNSQWLFSGKGARKKEARAMNPAAL